MHSQKIKHWISNSKPDRDQGFKKYLEKSNFWNYEIVELKIIGTLNLSILSTEFKANLTTFLGYKQTLVFTYGFMK